MTTNNLLPMLLPRVTFSIRTAAAASRVSHTIRKTNNEQALGLGGSFACRILQGGCDTTAEARSSISSQRNVISRPL